MMYYIANICIGYLVETNGGPGNLTADEKNWRFGRDGWWFHFFFTPIPGEMVV